MQSVVGALRVNLGLDSAKFERGVTRVSRSNAKLRNQFTAIAAAGAAALAGSIPVIAEFDRGMASLGAITRASAGELANMRNVAKDLGATTEFTAAQAAGGLRFLGMAGFEASEAVAAIDDVLNLATASSMGLAEAADVASNIMSAFGIAAEDAGDVADVLAAAASRANTDVSQLGGAMKFVGPVASSLGVSMSDAAAGIGVLSDAGIQGEMAGTSLRKVLSSLIGPSGASADAIRGMGLTLQEVSPEANDLTTIIRRLSDAGITAGDAMTIFGERGGPAILALTSQVDNLERLTGELSNVSGEAARMADTMRDNLGGDLDAIKSAVQGLVIAMGDAGLTAVIRGVLQVLTTVTRALTGVANGIGFLIGKADQAYRAMMGFGQSAMQTQIAIDNVTLAIADEVRAAQALVGSLPNGTRLSRDMATAKLEQARAHLASADAQRQEARAAVEAGETFQHYGAVIASIRATLDQFYDAQANGQQLPAHLALSVDQVTELEAQLIAATAAQQRLLEEAAPLTPEYVEVTENITRLEAALASARGEVVVINDVTSETIGLSDRLSQIVASYAGNLQAAGGGATYLGRTLASAARAAAILANGIGSVVGRLGALARGVANLSGVGRSVTAAIGGVGSGVDRVSDFFGGLADTPAVQRSLNALSQIGNTLGAVSEGFGRAIDAGYQFEEVVGGGGGGGGAAGAARKLKQELTPAQKAAEEFADAMENSVTGAVKGVSDAFGDFVVNGLRDFKGFARSILDQFKSTLSQMISLAVQNRIGPALGLSIGGIGAAGPAAAAGAGGVPGLGGIAGSLGGIGGAFVGGASSVISGLISGGFSGAVGAVGTAIGGATTGLAGLATAAGAVAVPLAAAAAAVSFFRGSTRTLDQGLRVTARGASLLVREFETIERRRFFGLSRSTSTNVSDADASLAAPIRDAYAQIYDSVTDMAGALGVGASALRNFRTTFEVSTEGMSEAEAQQAIQAEFAAQQNRLAAEALRGLGQSAGSFIRTGETATQALARLSGAMEVTGAVFARLGQDNFSQTGAGVRAASNLLDRVGGAGAFSAAADAFYQNFIPDRERLSDMRRSFNRAVRDLGIRSPVRSMEEFRQRVDRLFEQGRRTAAGGLIALAPLFSQIDGLSADIMATADAARDARQAERDALRSERQAARDARQAERAAERDARRADRQARQDERRQAADARRDEIRGLEDRLLQLQGNTAAIRARELDGLSSIQARSLQREIYALEDAERVVAGLTNATFASAADFQRATAAARFGAAQSLRSISRADRLVVGRVGRDAIAGTAGRRRSADDMLRVVLRELRDVRQNTGDTARLLRGWDNDGLPPEVTT